MTCTSQRVTGIRRTAIVFMLALLALLALQTSACAPRTGSTGQTSSGIATPSLLARDRLVIREHTNIVAVAATQRSVFAVSTHGLIVYDRIFRRWRAPDARMLDDLRAAGVMDASIRSIAADPVEDAVWIAVPGAVVIYRVAAQQVQRLTVAGQPGMIRFARGDASDAFVQTGNQWLRVSRAGFVTPVPGGARNVQFLPVAQLSDVYERYPALRGQLPLLLRDQDALATSGVFPRISSATFSFDQPSELFVGTVGDGLWSFNADFFSGAALRYGLRDDAVAALAASADGVWSAGRTGLTFVARDVQQFAWVSRGTGPSLNALAVRDIVVRGSTAWLGTDQGVRVMQVGGNAGSAGNVGTVGNPARAGGYATIREITTLNGLPDNLVSSVLPMSRVTWIGTRGGLAFITDTSSELRSGRTDIDRGDDAQGPVLIVAALRGIPVHALARSGSVLLVGTARGVFALDADRPGTAAAVAALWPDSRALQAPIRALATSDSMVLVVTDGEAVLFRAPDRITGAELRVPSVTSGASRSLNDASDSSVSASGRAYVDIRALGPVVAAALDERSVWVAGEGGVMSWGRDGAAPKVLRGGRELPAAVSDVLLDDRVVWIGTRQGLVRVQRAREGGLP